jgi:CIDE-N domain
MEAPPDHVVRFVLADDGCDVDEETIKFLPSKTTLIALKEDESFLDVCMQTA